MTTYPAKTNSDDDDGTGNYDDHHENTGDDYYKKNTDENDHHKKLMTTFPCRQQSFPDSHLLPPPTFEPSIGRARSPFQVDIVIMIMTIIMIMTVMSDILLSPTSEPLIG